jgi:acyl carrier protein
MSGQTGDEFALARHLVTVLELEDVDPSTIAPMAPLFGSGADGLGLDSIDALEVALMIQQQYGVELRSDDADMRAVFASLRALTSYVIDRNRKTL